MVSYKKLWKLLIDKDMKKQDLIAITKISTATMQKLNKGENLSTDILVRICNALQCNVSDIMDIIPTNNEKKYILKHKDIDVMEIILNEVGEIRVTGKVLNKAHLPVGSVSNQSVDYKEIRDWWSSRSIPASRERLKEVLTSLGLILPQQLLEKNFGLSLSDQYWICPETAALKWQDVNYFDNSFSEDVGDMFFGRILNKDAATIDLSSPDNTSDGILKKKWKIIGGKRCLIKGSRKPFNQEVANEILAARICKRLGIPFVDYWVIDIDGEKYSVCEDFITSNTELVAAWRITKLIKTDSNTSAYEAFVKKVEELGIVDARKRIDMMLTLDFIIVNTDRHYNNFGLIRDANTMKWLSVAPFFDSGSSMWHADLHSNINPTASHYESKPFNKKLEDQIKHVKDFSWLNFDALDGIEDEFREILEQAIPATAKIPARNKALCIALRKRIKLLQDIVKENELADDYQTRR